MTIEIIDCHAHVFPKHLAHDGAGLRLMLARCEQQGVVGVVVSLACERGELEVGPDQIQSVAAHSRVRVACSFGFEPPSRPERVIALAQDLPRALTQARRLASQGKLAAIGEVGLDYYWPLVGFLESQGIEKRDEVDAELAKQREALIAEPAVRAVLDAQADAFRQWIALAIETGLPLVVHERDAYADAAAVISDSGIEPDRVMLHCFSSCVEDARDAAVRGYRLSVPASVVYRQPYVDIAQVVDMDKVLLETDSPYHSPIIGLWKAAASQATERAQAEGVSRRALDKRVKALKGEMFADKLEAYLPGLTFGEGVEAADYFKSSKHRSANEPAFVRCGAAALAELRGEPFDAVCAQTTANARRLFRGL